MAEDQKQSEKEKALILAQDKAKEIETAKKAKEEAIAKSKEEAAKEFEKVKRDTALKEEINKISTETTSPAAVAESLAAKTHKKDATHAQVLSIEDQDVSESESSSEDEE